MVGITATQPVGRDRYLDLLKSVLTRELFLDDDVRLVDHKPVRADNWKRYLLEPLQSALAMRGFAITRRVIGPEVRELRSVGTDWPESAETMIGRARIDQLHDAVVTVLTEAVPGDLVETGVWRGGSVIFMRAVLAAYEEPERRVWVADSFEGLPPATHEHDIGHDLSVHDELAISIEEVKANFKRYGLLDDRVMFLKGWFRDTLPTAPIERIAVLRLDGDYYESTWDALDALYPKVSPGGFVIVDDYGIIEGCRRAVTEFRGAHGIEDEITDIDGSGVFWRRPAGAD